MTIVSALRKKLESFNLCEYQKIIQIFKYFEGFATKNKNIWSYLNKGVHEELDQPEFDVQIVNEILDNMFELDIEIKK
jgi:hypothetical protein